ncbi:MAG TPA: RNA-binding protein, partial [Streptomyces sp.]|nr:RNA-binding protein [Streptomyces sp.]
MVQGTGDGAEREPSTSSAASELGSRREHGADDSESFERPLPEKVRRRVVALTGDALGDLTVGELPGPLRQYARFTPQRRIKF